MASDSENDIWAQKVRAVVEAVLAEVGVQPPDGLTARIFEAPTETLRSAVAAAIDQLVFMRELPVTVASRDYDLDDMFEGLSGEEMRRELGEELDEQERRIARFRRLMNG